MIELLKVIGLTYIMCFGGMYYFASHFGRPPVLPGDVYRVNTVGKRMYFPFGGATILTVLLVILFMFLSSKFKR